jgi:aminoglycoside 3-N-acetyltransferase
MAFSDSLRYITPRVLLELYRSHVRRSTRKKIHKEFQEGKAHNLADLVADFRNAGIEKGDDVLVHASFSKIGAVNGGTMTFIDALIQVVGDEGHILMPNSPNASFQMDYIKHLDVFDLENDESRLGVLSETFRTMTKVKRSGHPTEPVSVYGPDADWYTSGHENEASPYSMESPFYKLCERKGKILYVGVTLANAGTSLHLLEEAVEDFIFPIYADETYMAKLKIKEEVKDIEVKVHNPIQSKKRRCDELLPHFAAAGVAEKVKIGQAETWLFDAKAMLVWMIEAYGKNKTTMYTPNGYPEKN